MYLEEPAQEVRKKTEIKYRKNLVFEDMTNSPFILLIG
tara:strand:- start:135 stop:248 length:114 start_codon:yes stop_codon:yes gene_type:complete